MAWRVTRLKASTLPVPSWKVMGVQATATVPTVEKVTLPSLTVEPGSVVTTEFPEYAGAVYEVTITPDVDDRGTGRARQFVAPPSITDRTYTASWKATRPDSSVVEGTQTITVLSATVRVVTGGVEVPAYWSDGVPLTLPPKASGFAASYGTDYGV